MPQPSTPIPARKSSPKHSHWGIASLCVAVLLAPEIGGVVSFFPGVGTMRLPAFVADNIGPWSMQAYFVALVLAIVGLIRDRAKVFSILSLVILVLAVAIVGLVILGLSQLTF